MTRTMLTGVYLIGVTLFLVAGSASFAEEGLEGQVVKTHLYGQKKARTVTHSDQF